tara:strand:+ start:6917 stop:7135 length:219 start_codon:yes stop_codon:yes gene_type:complete
MGNKRQANIRKRKKIKLEKEKRDLKKKIMKLMDIDIGKKLPIPYKMRIAMQLKLTRLIERYKTKYGDINGKM